MSWFIWLLIVFVGMRLFILGRRFAKNRLWGVVTVITSILEVGSAVLVWLIVGFTWQTFLLLFALRYFMAFEIQLVLQFCAEEGKEFNGFCIRKSGKA